MNYSEPYPGSAMADEALLELLRSDHEYALKEIFVRYNIRLFRIAVSVLGDEGLAKDSVQEVFIDLWNRRHTSNIQILSHFLARAVKFQVLKQLRNGKLHERHLKLIRNIQFVNQTEDSLNFQEMEISLKAAMENLPPRCREVFKLSRMENLSHKEIALKMGISTKTVEVQIRKALSYLRSTLDISALFVFATFVQ